MHVALNNTRGTTCGSHSLPYLVQGTIYGNKIVVDGPGDQLWWGTTCGVTVLYHRIHCFTRVEELPAQHHQMEKFLVPFHPVLYSYSKPGSVKIATHRHDHGMTEHPTQFVSSATQRGTYAKLTPKQSCHWKLCYLAWNKCCSTTCTPRNNFAN